MSTFWNNIPKPFFCLAPMADVTDAPFRAMFSKYGKPDVVWTEFVSADGFFLRPTLEDISILDKDYGANERVITAAQKHGVALDSPLLKDVMYKKEERPLVVQFFSRDPGRMKRAAAFAVDAGFDGIDINMGCPADVIVKQGAGCAMIKEPDIARAVIQATKEGTEGKIPVSVKTRIGFTQNELETWLPEILKEEPAVVSLHARTRKDMSKIPAKWETIKQAVDIRDSINKNILIVGNGDVEDLSGALKRVRETGCDGIMIGRGIFGNPWWFKNIEQAREDFLHDRIQERDVYHSYIPLEERLRVLVEHTRLYEKLIGRSKSFNIMKKHYKAYVNEFPRAKELRVKLMEAQNAEEVEEIIERFLG